MKKNKSWKTTLIAYITLALVIGAFIIVAIGKATLTELSVFLGAIGALAAALVGFFGKDSDVTHSKNKPFNKMASIGGDNPPPKKDEKRPA